MVGCATCTDLIAEQGIGAFHASRTLKDGFVCDWSQSPAMMNRWKAEVKQKSSVRDEFDGSPGGGLPPRIRSSLE
jgi:hypothetical protein